MPNRRVLHRPESLYFCYRLHEEAVGPFSRLDYYFLTLLLLCTAAFAAGRAPRPLLRYGTMAGEAHAMLCPIETSVGGNCGHLQLRDHADDPSCGMCHAHNKTSPGLRCASASLKGKAYCSKHTHPQRRRREPYDESAAMSGSEMSEEEEEKENATVHRTKAVRRGHRLPKRMVLENTLPARELRTRGLIPVMPASPTGPLMSMVPPSPTNMASNAVYERVACYRWEDGAFRRAGQGLLCLEPHSFACGGMRMAFHAKLKRSMQDAMQCQVIKIGIEAEENDRLTVEGEAEASYRARYYADLYNRYSWSKKVEFLPVSILQLVERRPPYNFATMELDLSEHGEYYKWNDNDGLVESSERRTPEAFSHFTLEVSRGMEIVVDIQGVVAESSSEGHVEVYKFTDPQIHSVKEGQYGIGNCGADGIEIWRANHRCNHLCREVRDHFLSQGLSWSIYNPDDDFFACERHCNHHPGDEPDWPKLRRSSRASTSVSCPPVY